MEPEFDAITGAKATNRRNFLRQVGKTIAVGLGVALLPAASASAAPLLQSCCRSTCKSCPTGQHAYTCLANGGCARCCICSSSSQNCFSSHACIC